MRLISKVAAIAALIFAAPVAAHDFKIGDLVIEHPYSFVTPPTAMAGAGYLTITNNGTVADRLVSVDAAYPRNEIHTTNVDENGVASMQEQKDGIEIAPGETITLQPGGLHIMFMGLDGDPFEKGETVQATLEFEKSGTIDVIFLVEERGEGTPVMDHSAHGDSDDKS